MDFFLSSMRERPLALTIATAVAVLILQLVYRVYRRRAFFRDLPGPPHSWLLGHLKVMGEIAALCPPNCHPQIYYTALARKYNLPGVFYIDLWPIGPASVILTDPDLLEQVTVTKVLPMHPMAEDFMSPIVGSGVVATANGPVWKSLHRAMSPAFSWSHIRSLTDLIVDECAIFRANLDKRVKTGELFSLEDLSAKLIFDVIARVVFNFPLNAQTSNSQHLQDLHELVALVEGQADITVAYNPVEQFRRWRRRSALSERLDPFIIGKIQERFDLLVKEQIVPSRKSPTSILDLMLRDHLQGADGKAHVSKTPTLSKHDMALLLTNIKGLLLGGHGTTMDTLCFTYMLLSKNPHVAEKMRQEHIDEFGADFNGSINTLLNAPERLQNLPYTDAVIREVMRLFPVGFGVREAPVGMTLEFNGRTLPIDNNLAICLNGHDLHYNERFFPNPTKFRPERWLEEEIPRSYFRTFGRGPRACLGQNLATNELKMILIHTIQDYEFEFPTFEPNKQPRLTYTDLDTVYGDTIYQELGLEAKPRGKMMTKVTRRS